MKILVISDTHKDIQKAIKIIDHLKKDIDMVIHLGDHSKDALDLSYIYPELVFHTVSGNCDWGGSIPGQKLVKVGVHKIFMAHGHTFGVKASNVPLIREGRKKGADILLFGHTHVPLSTKHGQMLIMNPGSLTYPRGKKGPSYGIITINKEEVKGDIYEYKRKNY